MSLLSSFQQRSLRGQVIIVAFVAYLAYLSYLTSASYALRKRNQRLSEKLRRQRDMSVRNNVKTVSGAIKDKRVIVQTTKDIAYLIA